MAPSSVSVVYTDDMLEVRRIPTCVMPHGSRLSPDGTAPLLRVHDERRAGGDRRRQDGGRPAFRAHCWPGQGMRAVVGSAAGQITRLIDIACGRRRRDLLAHVGGAVARRPHRSGWPATSPTSWYKSTSHPGRSCAGFPPERGSTTWRRAGTAGSWWHQQAGPIGVGHRRRQRSRDWRAFPRRDGVPSGVVISPDSRYAFVTQEGVGSEPGAVDVIDLHAPRPSRHVDVGQQAGGIDFWKTEAGRWRCSPVALPFRSPGPRELRPPALPSQVLDVRRQKAAQVSVHRHLEGGQLLLGDAVGVHRDDRAVIEAVERVGGIAAEQPDLHRLPVVARQPREIAVGVLTIAGISGPSSKCFSSENISSWFSRSGRKTSRVLPSRAMKALMAASWFSRHRREWMK